MTSTDLGIAPGREESREVLGHLAWLNTTISGGNPGRGQVEFECQEPSRKVSRRQNWPMEPELREAKMVSSFSKCLTTWEREGAREEVFPTPSPVQDTKGRGQTCVKTVKSRSYSFGGRPRDQP